MEPNAPGNPSSAARRCGPVLNRRSSKSKSGCRTCKIRRIKCDEARPSCRRCSSTGRNCDGYGIWTDCKPLPRIRQVLPVLPAAGEALTADDRLHLEHFLHRTAVKLPGCIASRFWERLVVQATFMEPAVFHASLALSGAHRNDGQLRKMREHGHLPTSQYDRFSTHQYGKAVTRLVNESASIRVSLVTCVVFVCMEMVRGNYRSGCRLIESGLGLVDGLAAAGGSCHSSDEWLMEALLTLNVQAALFGQMMPPRHRLPRCASSGSMSTSRARSELNAMLRDVLQLGRGYRLKQLASEAASPAMVSQRVELLESLGAWHCSLARIKHDDSVVARISLQSLALHYHMVRIMAEVCLSTETELVYDAQMDKFRDIVETSRRFLRTVWSPEIDDTPFAHTSDASHSTVGAGLVAPLLFTALKCRDGKIRRQAVDIMGSGNGTEVALSGRIAAAVARAVIHVEESEDGLPTDHCRVRDTHIEMSDAPTDTVEFTYTKPGTDGALQVFRQRCSLL